MVGLDIQNLFQKPPGLSKSSILKGFDTGAPCQRQKTPIRQSQKFPE